jgi:hypothetical protein
MSRDFNSRQMAKRFSEADPHFQWAVIVAEYAEILRGSYWAEGSSLYNVLEESQRVSELLPRDPDVREFVDLVRCAGKMSDW